MPRPHPPTAPPSSLSIWVWMRRMEPQHSREYLTNPPIIIDSSFENRSHIFFWFPKFFHLNQRVGGREAPRWVDCGEQRGRGTLGRGPPLPWRGASGLALCSTSTRPHPPPGRRKALCTAWGRNTKGACAGRAQGGAPSVWGWAPAPTAEPPASVRSGPASVSWRCDPGQRVCQGGWFCAGPRCPRG